MRPTREEEEFAALLEGLGGPGSSEAIRLARLAQALGRVRPAAGPSPAFRTALRNRLVAEVAIRRSWLDRLLDAWLERSERAGRSVRLVVASALAAAVLLAGGSILAVAETTVPGDLLYAAKRAREEARLLVTRAPEPRAYLQLDLARERLEEVRELVNRGERRAGPYLEALNDMDARTLDATRLLVEVYGRTRRSEPLLRLARFAAAQRNGLEVLLPRIPPAAQPPARDSLDILRRVADRVTGILSGCPCPGNPLLPGTGPPPEAEPGGAPETPQAPLCPCARIRGETGRERAAGPPPSGGTATPPPSGDGTLPPTPPPEDRRLDINVPDIPGTSLDDPVNRVVNDLIDKVLETVDDTVVDPLVEPVQSVLPAPVRSPLDRLGL
jgi:hypothetical protein